MNISQKRIAWEVLLDGNPSSRVLHISARVKMLIRWSRTPDCQSENEEVVNDFLPIATLGRQTFAEQGETLRRCRIMLKRALNLKCRHWRAEFGEVEDYETGNIGRYNSCVLEEVPESLRGHSVVHPANPAIRTWVDSWRTVNLTEDECLRLSLDDRTAIIGQQLLEEASNVFWGSSTPGTQMYDQATVPVAPVAAVGEPGVGACQCPYCRGRRSQAVTMNGVPVFFDPASSPTSVPAPRPSSRSRNYGYVSLSDLKF